MFRRCCEHGYIYQARSPGSSATRRRSASCPTATSRAPARTAATTTPAATSATTAARRSTPTDLIDPRCRFDGADAGAARHRALLPHALSAFNDRCSSGSRPQASTGARHVLNFTLGFSRRGCTTAPSPATSSGACRSRRRRARRGQAHLRLVRGRHRLPVGGEGVGAASRASPRPGATWWEDPEAQSLLLHRQGQHLVPHPDLAGDADGYGGLNLPYDVPANQYVNFGGEKGSTSRGVGRPVGWYLERYDPDAIRYYLAAMLPGAERHRVHRRRARAAQQRGAGRDLGQPGQPRADDDLPQLRRRRARPR